MPRRRGRGKPAYRPPVVSYRARPVIPYHPSMTSYGFGQIDAFIETCTDWDETKEKAYQLPSGESVCIKTFTKYFDKEKPHYIQLEKTWVDGILVGRYHTMRNKNSSCSGGGDRSTHPKASELTQKVQAYEHEEYIISHAGPILDKFCSPDFQFKYVKTDPSFAIPVTDCVSFGDLMDCQAGKSQDVNVDGTIRGYINTVRPFMPGIYKITVIQMFESSEPIVIYHHEHVDPVKISKKYVLHVDDMCDYHHDIRNSINRYDWCEWRNWGDCKNEDADSSGDEDELEKGDDLNDLGKDLECCGNENVCDENSNEVKEVGVEHNLREDHSNTIYFIPTENSSSVGPSVKKRHVQQSVVIPELYKILDAKREPIGFGVDMRVYNPGDWLYGRVYEDKTTDLNFALIADGIPDNIFMNGEIPQRLKDRYPKYEFLSLKDTRLRFDVSEFLLESNTL